MKPFKLSASSTACSKPIPLEPATPSEQLPKIENEQTFVDMRNAQQTRDCLVSSNPSIELLAQVDQLRKQATAALDQDRRAEMGQFMTPASVARLMASMFCAPRDDVRLLDAGAGTGSLTAAAVSALLARAEPPRTIEVTAYEVEPLLIEYLERTLELCREECDAAGVVFSARVHLADFLSAAAATYVSGAGPHFNCAILNPPYRKIRSASDGRRVCRSMGLEVSNLYAAFVGATIHLLEDGAEMVAITPRSFANGPYFRAFRRFLLDRVALRRLHVFDSRAHVFRDDDVLQENLVVYAEKAARKPDVVKITASGTPDGRIRSRLLPWSRVVYAHDPEQFIHLIVDEEGDAAAAQIAGLDNYLRDLGISVSTGPVVDFRARDFLRELPGQGTVPLLYPSHLNGGAVHWPSEGRAKWNALLLTDKSYRLTIPNGDYVLVKRFTAKEERRRVVASVYEGKTEDTQRVGFENHLNFFHENRSGLTLELARGLALYLNSTLVDTYFRQFSGHTQVNAGDLRNIPYPSRGKLEAAGRALGTSALGQKDIDQAVEQFLLV